MVVNGVGFMGCYSLLSDTWGFRYWPSVFGRNPVMLIEAGAHRRRSETNHERRGCKVAAIISAAYGNTT